MSATSEVTERTTCRACGSPNLTPLFSLGNLYVSNFVDEVTVKAGYAGCPRAPLDLQLCRGCTLVQLAHTAPQELLYARKYWYRSGTTQTMRNALKDVALAAERLVDLEDGDVVLDIGSNDGTLLRCFRPGLVRVGVEPADNLAVPENYEGINLIHDFWPTPKYRKWFLDTKVVRDGRAKVVLALGMFYDLEDPVAFVRGVTDVLHPDGVFVAQLMCLRQTVEAMDVGNICHEHLEYYSLQSLVEMYEAAGLRIFDLERNAVNGGSYRLYACLRTNETLGTPEGRGRVDEALFAEAEMRLGHPTALNRFYQDLLRNAHDVKALVFKARRDGKRVFVYGASTKGNTILQWMGLDATLIEAAVDKDPAKWGKFTVGTGIPVMSEEAGRQLFPDYMLCLPYAFRNEFIERERDQLWRKRGGKFIFPLPKLEVV